MKSVLFIFALLTASCAVAQSDLMSNGVSRSPVRRTTSFFDVRTFGVIGNGITDDTVAMQNAINAACQSGVHGMRILVWNSVTSKPLSMLVSSTIDFTKCWGVFFDGGSSQGEATENTSGFIWGGPAGGTVLLVNQTRDSTFQNFFIDMQTSGGHNNANVGLDIDEDGTVTTITTNDVYRNILVRSHDSNAKLVGLRLGKNAPGNVERQIFDHITVDCSDTAASSSNNGFGWQTNGANGAEPYWVELHDYDSSNCSHGIDIESGNILKIDGGLASGNYTDLYLNGGRGVSYSNVRSESGTAQIVLGATAGGPIDLTTDHLAFSGLKAGTSTYTYSLSSGGTRLRVFHNDWDNVAVTPIAGPTSGNSAILDSVDNNYPANECPDFSQFHGGWSSHLDSGFAFCPEGIGGPFLLQSANAGSGYGVPSPGLVLQGSIYSSGSPTADTAFLIHTPFYNNTKSYVSLSHPSTLTNFGVSLPLLFGGISTSTLTTPAIDNVLNIGTAGSTSYTYKIVANDCIGGTTAASAGVITSTGNASLDSTKYNLIEWRERSGACNYSVYRTSGGSTKGMIAGRGVNGGPVWPSSNTASGYFFKDTGLAGNGAIPASTNTTGNIFIAAHLNQLTSGTWAGTCTMTSGACAVITFATAYTSTPSCQVAWTGTGTLTGLLSSNRTTSGLQPKSSVGTDTAQVDWFCAGNPN